MSNIKTFRDLLVWQKAHELVLNLYKLTQLFPKAELFGLTNQIRRASVSIPANIVEGFRRHSLKDSLHFYVIADSSLEEVKYHILLAKDLNYICLTDYKNTINKLEDVGGTLTLWIKSQRNYLK